MKVVGAFLIDGKGRVLLAQRPEGKRLAGYWEFPGGKIEEGESPKQALKRELQEELRLDVRIVEDLGEFSYKYDYGTIDLRVFVAEPLNEPILTADVQAVQWFEFSRIDLERLAPADIAPLNEYLRRYVSGPESR